MLYTIGPRPGRIGSKYCVLYYTFMPSLKVVVRRMFIQDDIVYCVNDFKLTNNVSPSISNNIARFYVQNKSLDQHSICLVDDHA